SDLGLQMNSIGSMLASAMSQGYINFFDYAGRSYQVIPQTLRDYRLNANQLLNYYIKSSTGVSVPLSTILTIKNEVVPESLNHFQQLNSATISGITLPNITMGQALEKLQS